MSDNEGKVTIRPHFLYFKGDLKYGYDYQVAAELKGEKGSIFLVQESLNRLYDELGNRYAPAPGRIVIGGTVRRVDGMNFLEGGISLPDTILPVQMEEAWGRMVRAWQLKGSPRDEEGRMTDVVSEQDRAAITAFYNRLAEAVENKEIDATERADLGGLVANIGKKPATGERER